jgi:hypothetical protein
MALVLALGKVEEAEREVARLREEAERLAEWADMALVGKATVEVRGDVIMLTVPGKEGNPPLRRMGIPRKGIPSWLLDLMHMETNERSGGSAP